MAKTASKVDKATDRPRLTASTADKAWAVVESTMDNDVDKVASDTDKAAVTSPRQTRPRSSPPWTRAWTRSCPPWTSPS